MGKESKSRSSDENDRGPLNIDSQVIHQTRRFSSRPVSFCSDEPGSRVYRICSHHKWNVVYLQEEFQAHEQEQSSSFTPCNAGRPWGQITTSPGQPRLCCQIGWIHNQLGRFGSLGGNTRWSSSADLVLVGNRRCNLATLSLGVTIKQFLKALWV